MAQALHPDGTGDGEARPDEQCQNICHLDAARDLCTHIVKANVMRKQRFKAMVLRMQSVKAKGTQMTYDGAPHIGNTAVTVVASRHDYQTSFVSAKSIKHAVGSRHCDSI